MSGTRSARNSTIQLIGGLFLLGFIASTTSSFAQNLDDLARQERERRESSPRRTRVYTNEDLARPRILNPGDQRAIEESQAAEEAPTAVAVPPFLTPPVPAAASEPEPEPPSSLIAAPVVWPAGISLGDVARYYRATRQSRNAQLLAAKARKRRNGTASIAAASRLSSAAPRTPLGPPPLPKFPPIENPLPAQSSGTIWMEQPRSGDSIRARRGDSLWKIAERHWGDGKEWRKIAAANPQLADPDMIRVGEELRLPARESAPVAKQVRVQQGDSLWKLAATQLGNGHAWSCIAAANPQIEDSNRIYPGQLLLIPSGCSTGA